MKTQDFLHIQNKIQSNYPDSIILDVEETFYPNRGWIKTVGTMNAYTSPEEFIRRLKIMISGGATNFNFKVNDEYNQIRYPDYSAKELFSSNK